MRFLSELASVESLCNDSSGPIPATLAALAAAAS
ncbi:hypothetical protein MY10362_009842, partial [Beauveria mimosiformis]